MHTHPLKKVLRLQKNRTFLSILTLSKPWTKSPDSYLKEDSFLQSLEHFLSDGVRNRHNVLTICIKKNSFEKSGNVRNELIFKCNFQLKCISHVKETKKFLMFIRKAKTLPRSQDSDMLTLLSCKPYYSNFLSNEEKNPTLFWQSLGFSQLCRRTHFCFLLPFPII